MVMKYYLLEPDHDPGTGAETINRDLPRVGVTKALILDHSAQQTGTSVAATRINMAAQIDQVQIDVQDTARIFEMDGEDLDALNVLLGNHTLYDSATGANNSRIVHGMTLPLDPHVIGPRQDLTQPFGLGGNVARKVSIVFAADANEIDEKRLAIGIIVNESQGASSGYLTDQRRIINTNADTLDYVDVNGPGKLLGVLNFETTGAADITTDVAHRTDQTIEEEAIVVNRGVRLGPIYTTTMDAINGQFETGAITDEGYSFWNLGWFNKAGMPGIPQDAASLPDNMEVRTKRGDATDAGRVHSLVLNSRT